MAVYMENPNGKKYVFTNVSGVSRSKSSLSDALPMPGQNQQFVLKVGGVKMNVSISWTIKDEDTDVSDGTADSPIRTVADQIVYIEENFASGSMAFDWDIKLVIDWLGLAFYGVFSDFRWDVKAGERLARASLSIIVSKVEVI